MIIKRQIYVIIFTFFHVFILSKNSCGQAYNFQNYSLEDGLAQSQIISACYDSRGNMWFGSFGAGANMYNGVDFLTYNVKNGLSGNSIWSIYEDSNTNIWFGTNKGVCFYNGYRIVNIKDSLLSKMEVVSFLELSNGKMLLGTDGNGVLVYDGTTVQSFLPVQSIHNRIMSIIERKNGSLVFGSFGGGLYTYLPKTHQLDSLSEKNGLSSNFINNVWEDKQQKLWICTEKGVTKIKGKKIEYLSMKNGLPSNSISSVMEDKKGNYWLATHGGGAVKIQNENIFVLTENQGLCSNNLYRILEDVTGSLWFTSDGGGISKFNGNAFVNFSKKEGLKNDMINTITEDLEGNIWMGTEEEGLSKYDVDGKIINYGIKDGLGNKTIIYSYSDNEGNLWISCSETGVYRFDGKRFYPIDFKIDNAPSNIYAILQDNDGNMWFAGDGGGILKYNGKKSTIYTTNDGLINESIWCIAKDKEGIVWFGSDLGLIAYNGKEFTNYTAKDGLLSNQIIALTIDKNQQLWIGSENGINYYDGKKFKSYTTENGLTSDNIYSLIFDNQGSLIVGSEKGMDKVKLDENKNIKSVHFYNNLDGFRGVECNANAICKDKNGDIWLGTIKGATRYNSSLDETNYIAPITKITNVKLLFETPDWNTYVDSVTPFENLPVNLILPHNKKHLTFEFVGIDLKTPKKIIYSFQLEGFDEKWSPPSKKREITYSNLPPGNYTFKIKSANADGIWNEIPTVFQFTITPPFWKTFWFYSVVIIGSSIFLYLIYKQKIKSYKKAKDELEKIVQERTAEIEKQKKELKNLSLVASETVEGVAIVSHNGTIEWINTGLEKMTGYTFVEFQKSFATTIINPVSKKTMMDVLNEVKSSLKATKIDFEYKSSVGYIQWTSSTFSPILNDEGSLEKVVVIYSDITERKKIEQEILQKNKDITDSILYAKRIQEAIFPSKEILYNEFKESFILFKPKDIVSGDFYWFNRVNNHMVICVADCTGHGVPGAFMSMIGNEFLHQVVGTSKIDNPSDGLAEVDLRIRTALGQKGNDFETKDGMDIAMCAVNMDTLELQYAGAYRPVLIIRDQIIITLKPDKISIGGYKKAEKFFTDHTIALQKGDQVYLFSDGYVDQFGGPKHKKFLLKRFKELLVEITNKPMQEQKKIIWKTITDWKGKHPQIDDICMLGFRV